ncbi:MAG: SpoIID/LytB domain-containing protein [Firmicutes bacterium]|nr:SpoIID/LytB domain-containing protein [Bacillota bacterium]
MPRELLATTVLLLVLILGLAEWAVAAEPELEVKLTFAPPFSLACSGNVQLFFLPESKLAQKPYLPPEAWLLLEEGALLQGTTWEISLEQGEIVFRAAGREGEAFRSKLPLLLRGAKGSEIKLNGRLYSGTIQFWPGEQLSVFNRLGLEDYVAGVLSSEAYASWPLEALKANAVAIRTYTLYSLGKHEIFDLCDQVHCQVYRGLHHLPVFKEAVAATQGQVLTWNGKLIEAVYHSSSGGRTRNNDEVWASPPLPYLRAVEDFDQAGRNYYWPQAYLVSLDELARALGFSAGQRIELSPFLSPAGDRLGFVFFATKQQEKKRFRNEELRRLFSFPSANFRVLVVKEQALPAGISTRRGVNQGAAVLNNQENRLQLARTVQGVGRLVTGTVTLEPGESLLFFGNGSGHGVGLSQWGAVALAERDYSYQEILRHYYGDEVRFASLGE